MVVEVKQESLLAANPTAEPEVLELGDGKRVIRLAEVIKPSRVIEAIANPK